MKEGHRNEHTILFVPKDDATRLLFDGLLEPHDGFDGLFLEVVQRHLERTVLNTFQSLNLAGCVHFSFVFFIYSVCWSSRIQLMERYHIR